MAASEKGSDVPAYIDIDEGLSLRQLAEGDAEAMFASVSTDRDHLGQWLPWAHETHSVSDSLEFILGAMENRSMGTDYQFGIFYDGAYIGNVGLHNADGEKEPEVGYWVSREMGGRGIATRATRALLDLAFVTLDLPTVRIRADVRNVPSNKVIRKCGFTFIETVPHEEEDRLLNVYRIKQKEWHEQQAREA